MKTWTPAAYIAEEVRRQGFDLETERGQVRVRWMGEAWEWAEMAAKERRYPRAADIIEIGKRVEQVQNAAGIRTCGVRVGSHIAPPWTDVRRLLADLEKRIRSLDPFDFYRALLRIHPFIDGKQWQGREGRLKLGAGPIESTDFSS